MFPDAQAAFFRPHFHAVHIHIPHHNIPAAELIAVSGKPKHRVRRLMEITDWFEKYARQEKEGKKVVNWIFGALIVLAIAYMIYMVVNV